jgi:hypothetical protein
VDDRQGLSQPQPVTLSSCPPPQKFTEKGVHNRARKEKPQSVKSYHPILLSIRTIASSLPRRTATLFLGRWRGGKPPSNPLGWGGRERKCMGTGPMPCGRTAADLRALPAGRMRIQKTPAVLTPLPGRFRSRTG